jgi:hypothetical protein
VPTPKQPSISKLLGAAYAIGYGDAQRDVKQYWENPSLRHIRRYSARKTTVIKTLMKSENPR